MAEFELAEDFLPVYDVSDAVATVADADREKAWGALLDVDRLKLGREAPLVGMLGALRTCVRLRESARGRRPAARGGGHFATALSGTSTRRGTPGRACWCCGSG